ncbi:molybdenum ABC transporter substrate-binding protein [Azospirillum thiophilum]|uniref:Molybdenum ABC transporter substrate-binding protein n=1 Tax=Azospirillum thiophilum TaxID=528244 RepID=A0AAC8VZF2_9PROT|nr:molybdate ABC transporter substrate-binding protein [Azospirillum thiophilum]ALG72212.1 molybdenum ABC transporter substrate-binding protein [Azospirillum thiophilum]KJR66962.1 molybdenum ABC transporter substrate-binding protein [Azospirillum thiophilum]
MFGLRLALGRRDGCRAVARAVSVAVLGFGLTLAAPAAMAQDVLVLAAASTKNAVEKLASQFKAKTGMSVTSSFAASSALAKQIENGAPADIFISADLDWMDYLQQRNLIKADSRVNLLGNELVVVAPKGSPIKPDLSKGGTLAAQLGDGRLATGDPSNVPVGKYAKAALEKLGQWTAVEPKLARADSVRAALVLVSRGEVPLGIVYRTDAAIDPGVEVAAVFPPDSYPAIVYPAALTAISKSSHAAAFLDYIKSPDGMAVWKEFGFVPAPKAP